MTAVNELVSTQELPADTHGITALVVEDDADLRASLALLMTRQGFSVIEAASLGAARAAIVKHEPDVVFTDLRLPDGYGLDLLSIEDIPTRPDFVVITGHATVEVAVDAFHRGVLDLLTKPVDRVRLRAILANAVRTRQLRRELSALHGKLRDLGRFGSMVGRSAPMLKLYDLIARIAPTRASVLIAGESGTGKELAAETVHRMSPRAGGPFLAVNCGALAHHVIESELFGHERGSFTGAERSRKGYFEHANGGTLLLDEVAEMPLELQVKLLRVIETGQVLRVGASESVAVDVRVLAATNRDPERAIREGRLREDLYYRLNVFPLLLPPLRERGDDIRMLAEHFLAEVSAREGLHRSWSKRALDRLASYAWPGNVRELRNLAERQAILSGEVIEETGLPEEPQRAAGHSNGSLVFPVGSPLADVERRMILATLRMTGGDKRDAAWRLGISLKTLYNRLNVYEAAGRTES